MTFSYFQYLLITSDDFHSISRLFQRSTCTRRWLLMSELKHLTVAFSLSSFYFLSCVTFTFTSLSLHISSCVYFSLSCSFQPTYKCYTDFLFSYTTRVTICCIRSLKTVSVLEFGVRTVSKLSI